MITPIEKVLEYRKEFSVEKSIEIAETMLEVAKYTSPQDKKFWKKVILILKSTTDSNKKLNTK